MKDTRISRAKRNIAASFFNQLICTLCGIIVPRVMIGAYGSVVYGATTSIAKFLSYISVLEGGIGWVARAALYAPLSQRDERQISRVYHAVRRFFSNVGLAFLIYTLALSLVYHDIGKIEVFSRDYTFLLVWAISFTTVAKYLWGLPNITLLNADQKQYITSSVIMATTVINVLLIVILTQMGCNVVIVKLCSSLVFVVRPLILWCYVKRHYNLARVPKDKTVLQQKWTGLSQHIAYTIHTNTDVVILTLFADLRLVSVYSVYYMVINSIRSIAGSFASGMEAVFGEIIARGEQQRLQSTYRQYKLMLSMVCMVLFGAAAILIVPFVRLYTAGISDANYIQPVFAGVLLLAEGVNCIMLPCTTLPVSANRLRQTRWGAYGEALLNLGISCVLVLWNPLVGVALGTLTAVLFKSVFYMTYAARHILRCRPVAMGLRFVLTICCWGMVWALGMWVIQSVQIENFFQWIIAGILVVVLMGILSLLTNWAMYPAEMKNLVRSVVRKIR